jgi:hypothetical protein
MPLVFQDITDGILQPIPDQIHEDLATSVEDWKLPELRARLKSRRVSFLSATKKEGIVALVNLNFSLPQLKLFNHAHHAGTSLDLVMNLITCLNKLMSAAMQRVVNEEVLHRVDVTSKVYLSAVHALDFFMNGHLASYKPIWIGAYNPMCIKNMVAIMRHFGPVRLYREGADRGEKFLQEVKPLIHNMIGNWQYNVHVRIHKRRSLQSIMKLNNNNVPSSGGVEELSVDDKKATENSGRKGRDAQNYKSLGSGVQAITNGKSLSCYLDGDRVLVGLRNNTCGTETTIVVHKMVKRRTIGEELIVNGCVYSEYYLNELEETVAHASNMRYCFLLPKFGRPLCYSVTKDNWN